MLSTTTGPLGCVPKIPRCLWPPDSLLAGSGVGAMGQQTPGSSRSLSSLPGWTHPVQIGLSFLVPVELFYFYFGFLFFCFFGFFFCTCLFTSLS